MWNLQKIQSKAHSLRQKDHEWFMNIAWTFHGTTFLNNTWTFHEWFLNGSMTLMNSSWTQKAHEVYMISSWHRVHKQHMNSSWIILEHEMSLFMKLQHSWTVHELKGSWSVHKQHMNNSWISLEHEMSLFMKV
jgi:hypothetical protein